MADARRDSPAPAAWQRAVCLAREHRAGSPDLSARSHRSRDFGLSAGWDDRWAEARREIDPGELLEPVRIAAEHRGAYEAVGDGGVAWVELTGKTFHEAADKRALPTVGDWVLVERWREALAKSGAGIVRAILPRRTLLVRRAAGEATAPQPLAANVDVGLVVTSANADLSLPRLDRYIGLLRDGGIEPAIVVSKLDLASDPA